MWLVISLQTVFSFSTCRILSTIALYFCISPINLARWSKYRRFGICKHSSSRNMNDEISGVALILSITISTSVMGSSEVAGTVNVVTSLSGNNFRFFTASMGSVVVITGTAAAAAAVAAVVICVWTMAAGLGTRVNCCVSFFFFSSETGTTRIPGGNCNKLIFGFSSVLSATTWAIFVLTSALSSSK